MSSEKRIIRERIIDAALLSLAKEMDANGPMTVLQEIFGEDTELPLEVFASMMRRRELWDAHLNGVRSATPPPSNDETEFIYMPGRTYPSVGRRPVRWATVTKTHFSEQEFSAPGNKTTACGLNIPQLAVVYPMDQWHPGSDETCKLCLSIRGEAT